MIIVDDKVEVRYKRGDVREDGKIFWKKRKDCVVWLTPEKFEQYRAKHANGVKLYGRRNKVERKAYFDKWYSENKALCRESSKKWVLNNQEKVKEIQKRFRKNHPEKVKANIVRWKENNPEKYKLIKRRLEGKRRAIIDKQSINLTESQVKIVNCFYDQAQRLEKRLGIKFHVDHVIPIARGGKHEPTNLQVMPATLNIQKHAREIYKWAELQQN